MRSRARTAGTFAECREAQGATVHQHSAGSRRSLGRHRDRRRKRLAPQAAAVAITLLSLDKDSYTWGGPLIFELRIENIGDQPQIFPWTLDWRLAPPDGKPHEHAVVAILGLVLGPDVSGKNKELSGIRTYSGKPLHGATDAPGTFIALQPHQTARIRMPARVTAIVQRRPDLPCQVPVQAELSFNEGPLSGNYRLAGSYQPSISNALMLRVRDPR